jgi:hypothetical protein
MSPAALVAVPIVGGCLSRASVFAVGACTIVVFPVHTLASGIVNGSWGNLWPIELATQAALAVGCMVLAGIGRWARRKMGRSGG